MSSYASATSPDASDRTLRPRPPRIASDARPQPQTPLDPGKLQRLTDPCGICDSRNSRKLALVCGACSRPAHLSCARLTRAQACSLPVWHCPRCLQGDTSALTLDPAASSKAPCPPDAALALHRLRSCTRILPRVPKGARTLVAENLVTQIRSGLSDSSPEAWWCLLSFAPTAPPLRCNLLATSTPAAPTALSLPSNLDVPASPPCSQRLSLIARQPSRRFPRRVRNKGAICEAPSGLPATHSPSLRPAREASTCTSRHS